VTRSGKWLRSSVTVQSMKRDLCAVGEKPGNFDLVLVNDSLQKAYEILRNFIFERLGKEGEGKTNKSVPPY